MAFDWLAVNWWPGLDRFTSVRGIPANIWAYILSLGLVVCPIVKVSFGYFAESRLDDTAALYRTYLNEGEIDLLAGYIKKYHIDDIQKYLEKLSDLPEDRLRLAFRKRAKPD